MKSALLSAAILLVAGTSFAAGELKASKVVACQEFTTAKLADGTYVGVCQREGKKPRFLTSFTIAKVSNPSTRAVESVLVGFP